jgi:hypothetical protein
MNSRNDSTATLASDEPRYALPVRNVTETSLATLWQRHKLDALRRD